MLEYLNRDTTHEYKGIQNLIDESQSVNFNRTVFNSMEKDDNFIKNSNAEGYKLGKKRVKNDVRVHVVDIGALNNI